MSNHTIYSKGITVADTPSSELDRCNSLRDNLKENGFFTISEDRWRLSPEPFYISKELSESLRSLGGMLLSFYRALNNLYFMALKGRAPSWIVEYLDMGKPDSILRYSRMKRFKNHLPIIIRPDILITEKGIVATELDAVPGGMGITATLSSFFAGYQPVGGGRGMVEGFISAFKSLVEAVEEEINLAFVISDESDDYRGEMEYVAGEFRKNGLNAHALHPAEVVFKEEGLFVREGGLEKRLHIVYRFFELFDTVNIPKAELIFYAAKQKKVVLTPPIKPFLEEKLAYALFHHPGLKNLWIEEVGEEVYYRLKELFPRTWILDPRLLPPYGVIPDLQFRGQAVSSWDFLRICTQKERRYVIKPSGFSELAWGGRGVVIGHDLPLKEWNNAIDRALDGFYSTPCILQEFKKGRRERARYLNIEGDRIEEIEVRARLTPYYFVCGEEARLSGVLATLCPADKKILHGMKDAIMTVCAVRD